MAPGRVIVLTYDDIETGLGFRLEIEGSCVIGLDVERFERARFSRVGVTLSGGDALAAPVKQATASPQNKPMGSALFIASSVTCMAGSRGGNAVPMPCASCASEAAR